MTIYKVTSQKKDAEKEFTFEADTPLEFFVKANYACQKNNVLSTQDVVSLEIVKPGGESNDGKRTE